MRGWMIVVGILWGLAPRLAYGEENFCGASYEEPDTTLNYPSLRQDEPKLRRDAHGYPVTIHTMNTPHLDEKLLHKHIQAVNMFFEFKPLLYIQKIVHHEEPARRFSSEKELTEIKNVPGTLNIYYLDQSIASYCGLATFPHHSFRGVFINTAPTCMAEGMVGESLVAHEIGHLLGLRHTHHLDYADFHDPHFELVRRDEFANCKLYGDGLCGTPADPGLLSSTGYRVQLLVKGSNTSCVYQPEMTFLDAEGLRYEPDVYNIMSYTHPQCRQGLHDEQKKLARATLDYLAQEKVSSANAFYISPNPMPTAGGPANVIFDFDRMYVTRDGWYDATAVFNLIIYDQRGRTVWQTASWLEGSRMYSDANRGFLTTYFPPLHRGVYFVEVVFPDHVRSNPLPAFKLVVQ